ncbi:hypothetical protein [Adhaeribacter terreus]|uniref:Uncharacterized protein n=1 Tax=Adhaeribacter terreus TaxID=529703 RepID=A0ABW0EDF5_9BACT
MKKRDPQFNLIPHRFKFIGLGIAVLAALFLIGMKEAWFGLAPEQLEPAKTYGLNFFILGLLFIALAKEKVEDERTFTSKTKAFAGGFVGAVISAIIWSSWNLLFKESSLQPLTGQGLAMLMLFTYLATFYLQKLTGEEA